MSASTAARYGPLEGLAGAAETTFWESMTQLSNSDRGTAGDPAAGLSPGKTQVMRLPALFTAVAVPLLAVGALSALGLAISTPVAPSNIPMLYLAAVVVSALIGGRLPALLAAGLSFLAYNFFFIEPRWNFAIAHPDEVIALLVFVGVALVVGTLTARLSEHTATVSRQAEATEAQFEFSRKLSAALGLEATYVTLTRHVGATLGLQAILLVPGDDDRLAIAASEPPEQDLTPDVLALAQAASDRRKRTGFMTDTGPEASYTFVPIFSGQHVLGVLGLRFTGKRKQLSTDQDRALVATIDQAAVAIDRARWARENALAAVSRESERLQSALLSSLSHDFRTPLASITGAATSLRQLGDKMDVATRDDLLASIEQDAGQLNRFVANLFDMTRIESGAIKVRREAVDIPEVVERAVSRMQSTYPGFEATMSFADHLPPAQGDAILLEQVLFNLLDNARKYGGSDHPVAVFARVEDGRIAVTVTDQGKGITAEDLERIFEKFYRRAKGDGRAAGTGLGLSIARGFITAMGGSISAESPAARKHGTRFLIRLPLAKAGAA